VIISYMICDGGTNAPIWVLELDFTKTGCKKNRGRGQEIFEVSFRIYTA
jgi:hypothetical protein